MLRATKVLVTGGTGFIGGRLVERLCLEHGASVRVLVRNLSRASRLARFPVEMVAGDITQAAAVQQATQGCEFVFHCAYDFAGDERHRRAASVGGTRNVADAALRAGATRVVHVSTVSVYGTPAGAVDESSPRAKTGDLYADTKLEAENLMLQYHREKDLPVVIVQPTIVYGPFSRSWTISVVEQLMQGPVALPGDGDGCCNAVYIDDVVDGMILAATKDEAIGESFLLSAAEPVTWREFFQAYQSILGVPAVVSLELNELGRGSAKRLPSSAAPSPWAQWREVLALPQVRAALVETPIVNWPYRLVTRLAPRLWTQARQRYLDAPLSSGAFPGASQAYQATGSRQVQIPSSARLALYQAKTCVRIDKARRMLGFQPLYDLERGMASTGLFIDWYFSR